MIVSEKFDVKGMSGVIGKSVTDINYLLGKPISVICDVRNIEDARNKFYIANPDSEERLQYFRSWVYLANNIYEVRKAFKCVSKNSVYEAIVLEKWNLFSMEEVKKIITIADSKKVVRESPENSEARLAALEMNRVLSWNEIGNIKTFADGIKAIKNALPQSQERLQAIEICIGLIDASSDAKRLLDSITAPSLKAKLLIFKKWNLVSLEEVKNAVTKGDTLRALKGALPNSEAELAAIVKLSSFFGNEEED